MLQNFWNKFFISPSKRYEMLLFTILGKKSLQICELFLFTLSRICGNI